MKRILLSAIIPALIGVQALAQSDAPYVLEHYGHFKKMNHLKQTDGVVDLGVATDKPNLYGVGAPAHGTGEITVLNGKLWLDYGADGLGNAVHQAAEGEKAVLLVTAQVEA